MEEKADFIEKIMNVDRRVLYWILAATFIIPMMMPFGLPIAIGEHTKQTYQIIREMGSEDVVVIGLDIGFATIPELGPSLTVTLHELFSKGAKVIVVGLGDIEPVMFKDLVVPVAEEYNLQYGVDYMNLGFIPGGETAQKRMADDLPGTAVTDAFGTKVEEIPMLNNVNNAGDVDLLITFESGQSTIRYIRHWHMKYDTRIIASLGQLIVTDLLPYVSAGTLDDFVGGMRGGAEMELLANRPGPAVARMDVISATHLYLVLLIILGNVLFFATRGRS